MSSICQVKYLLSIVKRMKMSYFGRTMRHDSLNKTVIQGGILVKEEEDDSDKTGWIT